ncbi:MAG: O-antigen ligase family protein [Rhodospirillales bacterium]|nr:O-antigen ligase family protein [Rhodospirillales bacterium]
MGVKDSLPVSFGAAKVTGMTVPEIAAAIALGLFGVAVLSGRATFAAVVAVGVLAVLASPGFKRTTRRCRQAVAEPLVVAAGVVLAAWLPSVVFSEMPWVSVQVFARMVLFLMLGLLLFAYFTDRAAALNLLFKIMFTGLAAGSAVCILAILFYPGSSVLLTARAAGTSAGAALMFKAAGSGAVVMIPLVLWAGWRLGGRWKVAGIALSTALLALVTLTSSRAGLAGFIGAVGITLLALALRPETRRWVVLLALVYIVVITAIAGYLIDRYIVMVLPEDQLIFPSWLIDPHRQLIWSFALDLGSQQPWVGWGINTINLVQPAIDAQTPDPTRSPLPSHPHNWVIEIFAETGIVGVLPMLIAVSALFIVLLRRFHATGDLRFAAMLAASAAFWVSGLFNFSFWSAWWQVSYILVLAFLCAGRGPAAATRKSLVAPEI